MSRKHDEHRSGLSARAFLVPMAWIVALLAGYWVLADWQALPGLITATFTGI
jgi:hypothetical protein